MTQEIRIVVANDGKQATIRKITEEVIENAADTPAESFLAALKPGTVLASEK